MKETARDEVDAWKLWPRISGAVSIGGLVLGAATAVYIFYSELAAIQRDISKIRERITAVETQYDERVSPQLHIFSSHREIIFEIRRDLDRVQNQFKWFSTERGREAVVPKGNLSGPSLE